MTMAVTKSAIATIVVVAMGTDSSGFISSQLTITMVIISILK
jgi:hypothetical protein